MEIDGVIHVALRKGTFFVYSMESISNQQKKHNLYQWSRYIKIEHSDFEVISFFSTIEIEHKLIINRLLL